MPSYVIEYKNYTLFTMIFGPPCIFSSPCQSALLKRFSWSEIKGQGHNYWPS